MSLDRRELISRYLDDDLSTDEHTVFQEWLIASSEHMAQFVQSTLLHDRLRGELTQMSMASKIDLEHRDEKNRNSRKTVWKPIATLGATLAGLVLFVALWHGLGSTPVSAATELNRMIAAQVAGGDRTYRIDVEEIAAHPRDRKRPEDTRPPKPPMTGAKLHVRHGNQFVLIRQTREGLPFVTGCNGRVSWAVRPSGPVRVSSDLTRFNRDLPGHEHGMPLINLEEGLGRLKEAYNVTLLPIEAGDKKVDLEQTSLFIAVKRWGFRGPQRVEITYKVATGKIQQLRFVEMPYGPDRLTLRLTLLEERDLGETYFDHQSHHESDRTIAEE